MSPKMAQKMLPTLYHNFVITLMLQNFQMINLGTLAAKLAEFPRNLSSVMSTVILIFYWDTLSVSTCGGRDILVYVWFAMTVSS